MADKLIFKYLLPEPVSTLRMPEGANILTVAHQPGQGIVLWAEVDPDQRGVNRVIEAENTGALVPKGKYIGTCSSAGGTVWHVYDLGEHEPILFPEDADVSS